MSVPTAPEAPAPSHRKIWIAGAFALGVLAVLLWLETPVRNGLQSAWFDGLQVASPRVIQSMPATVVAIDEKSLAELGQWPWPRTTLAALIDAIARYQPAAIGIDILMPEADRLSPERLLADARSQDPILAERLARLPTHDAALARSLAAAPTVMAFAGAPAPTGATVRVPPMTISGGAGGRQSLAIARLAGVTRSVDVLDEAAAGHGVISVGNNEAVIRRIPLVFDIDGTLAPALSIEMLRVAVGQPAHRVAVNGSAVRAIAFGDFSTSTERDGAVRVYYSHRDARRFISAIDVLKGDVDPQRLAQKLVLIGMTGQGLIDYQLTPLRERMPGSEIHAQLLENLFDETLLARPDWGTLAELAMFLLLGGLLVYATPRWKPRDAALLAIACVALPTLIAYFAFRSRHWLLDAATPAVGLLVLFGMLLVLALAEAARQRRSLERVVQAQREQAAYVAGELEAAHRIQTGILPHADLLRDDPRIDLAATMTTAREVGGDLYDFFRLGENRLFFIVGDVAGKGLSASIFMAVSKALYKSSALRDASGSIGELMSVANAEVSRDNSESLFVTAFAATLDLQSGVLDYCNAGNENPWVLASGRAGLGRLDGDGGPPLCAIDDYAYQGSEYRLAPGEFVVIVTDGVTEAQNKSGELYGGARLEALLAALDPGRMSAAGPPQGANYPGVRSAEGSPMSAEDIVTAVCADVSTFVAGAEPSDDLTVLVLRWRGGG